MLPTTGGSLSPLAMGCLLNLPALSKLYGVQSTCSEVVAEREADRSDHDAIVLRIGINIGDIIIDREDIYGDGVNIAARLEALAEPGTICVSAKVYEEVRQKLQLNFEDIGEQTVKNIPDPVHAYRVHVDQQARALPSLRPKVSGWNLPWQKAGAAAAAVVLILGASLLWQDSVEPTDDELASKALADLPEDPALSMPTGPTIALLPFRDLSPDQSQDYLAIGVTDEIIAALSRFHDFRVIATDKVLAFEDHNVPPLEAGSQLGADFVMDGSVKIAGDTIRIAASLLNVADGTEVWTENYDRHLDPTKLIEIQDEIAANVAGSVGSWRGAVARKLLQDARRKPPEELEAYECVLRASYTKTTPTGADPELHDAVSRLFRTHRRKVPRLCRSLGISLKRVSSLL